MNDASKTSGIGQLIGVPCSLANSPGSTPSATQTDMPSRPETVRRLCVQALNPRSDNAAKPAPRPLREVVREFFGSIRAGRKRPARRDADVSPIDAAEFCFCPEDDTSFVILQRAARDVLETFRRFAQAGDPAAREVCARMRAILDDQAIADQDKYLTPFASGSRRRRAG